MKEDTLLVEGVTFDRDNDAFVFDFQHDSERDIVKVVSDGPYQIEDYEPCTYFGYVFEDNVDTTIKKQFIDLMKYPTQRIEKTDLNRFVQRAVASLDKKISLPKYDVIVYPQSSSKLNHEIINAIYAKALNEHCIKFELIKSLPSKMDFNYENWISFLEQKDGINQNNIDQSVSAIKDMMEKIKKLDYVKIGTYIKAKYRPYLKNFFSFADDEAKKTFESLQDKKILIVDDVSTTRATLQYVLNTIRVINDTCDITMFCLLGNKVR